MFVTASPCCHALSFGLTLASTAAVDNKLRKPYVSFFRTSRLLKLPSSKTWRNNWRSSCFKHDESSLEYFVRETSEDVLPGEIVEPERREPDVKHDWISNSRKFSFVDHASFEKTEKFGSGGNQIKEPQTINKSLSIC